MNALDIILAVAVGAAFLAVVAVGIYKKITHKGGGCDCGCASCPHSSACRSAKKK